MIVLGNTSAASESSVNPIEWFAIRVKSNRDQVVATSLSDKGYLTFFPKYKERRTSRELAPKDRPLFPGYVFCRFDVLKRLPILMVPGVVHVVGIGKTPIPIPDDEIDSIRLVIDSDLPITPVEHFAVGEKVRIDAGPLTGALGTVTDRQRGLFVVSITLLQRSLSVALPLEWLTKSRNGPIDMPSQRPRASGYNRWPEEGACT